MNIDTSHIHHPLVGAKTQRPQGQREKKTPLRQSRLISEPPHAKSITVVASNGPGIHELMTFVFPHAFEKGRRMETSMKEMR